MWGVIGALLMRLAAAILLLAFALVTASATPQVAQQTAETATLATLME